ncbi:MAG: hypothetical protein IPP74_12440 [Alphaproteobacteria bacterium]|nr:hypothetical protein [Alphaproteobacteria bacterium]
MDAKLLVHEKVILDTHSLIEIRVWHVPNPVPPSRHNLKYSMVYIVNNRRVIGYDNERGKGDHRHYEDEETSYHFESIEKLLAHFKADVEAIRGEKI